MSLREVAVSAWSGPSGACDETEAIESGNVLFCRDLRFEVAAAEALLFTPAILGSAKNASFDPATGRLGGTSLTGKAGDDAATALGGMMRRFSDAAAGLVNALCPTYRGPIVRGRASFRPAEIAGRASSWRKDDTRLHVDSFPATPSGGKRILRVFTNVNPEGRARTWRIGDEFESVARRFAASLRLPLPGAGHLLALLRVTKSPRTPYDALMLQLHDRMKADDEFQSSSPQSRVEFPSGSTWLTFTDQVSHAAMAGQYQLEQTFLVPVDAMLEPARAPLRILERLKGRALV
ncbi:MAG TPA: Kdo hydroxylase family protein [Vicinamibacterales bacterium]|nr:Kdo hydroxylase family protein [Vicinamibacterales bacterium]